MIDRISQPYCLKWLMAACVAQWMSIPIDVRSLVVFMAIDYASGLACAFVRKELSSQIGLRGLVKKSMVLLLLFTLRVAEQTAGLQVHIEQICTLAYVVNELISIVENCAKVGMPIPEQLVTALLSAKKLRVHSATPEQISELENG